MRLDDAERVSEELKDIWGEIQRAYLQLIVCLSPYSLLQELTINTDNQSAQHRAPGR
jgi:hypothetical protein